MEPKIKYHNEPSTFVIQNDDLLQECSNLYSNHYGNWSEHAPDLAGKRIQLSPKKIKEWLSDDEAQLIYATIEGNLVGYCIATHEKVKNYGKVVWVTQLVVHDGHRNKGIGKRLLFSVWRMSDYYAWGVVTSSPYAIRALETATRRRSTPDRINKNKRMLLNFGDRKVCYVNKDIELLVASECSALNTEFFSDHSDIDEKIANVTRDDVPWTLGKLEEGWEWFAFTFHDQEQTELSSQEVAAMLAASDDVTNQAYSRMSLDSEHSWTKHFTHEVNFIQSACDITTGASVLDFGCGKGRHSLEFAKNGFEVTGVDYSAALVTRASENAKSRNLGNCKFIIADCRDADIGENFDLTLCLYDVVGSFIQDEENIKILNNLYRHTKTGGWSVISVMNYELTEAIAINIFSLKEDPSALLDLPPSQIMEQTGDIYNPDYFLLDKEEQVVYRKEQFLKGNTIPQEFIVRDKRYKKDDIVEMCHKVGFTVVSVCYVRTGAWDKRLEPTDIKAKEVLVVCRKN